MQFWKFIKDIIEKENDDSQLLNSENNKQGEELNNNGNDQYIP